MKLNKFTKILCFAIVSVFIMASTAMAVNVNSFVDFPNDWSTPAMEYAVENGLIKGYEDNTIRANQNITRAEMAAIINRAFGSFVEATKFPYLDVEDVDWYYSDMKKAVNMGTMQGDGEKYLRPDDAITREEAFVVIARAYSQKDSDFSPLDQYPDKGAIHSWSKDYLSFLTRNDYINGFDDGNLYPQANLTRAELSQLLFNMIAEYLNSQEALDAKDTYTDNVVINGGIAEITGKTFEGDLVIGDGVGTNKIVIKDTKIAGALVVRGTTQIKIVNSSVGNRIIVNNPNNNVHFDNYRNEKVFNNVETQTSATWKKSGGGSSTRYFSVDFNRNYVGGGIYVSQSVKSGSTVSEPIKPSRTGYKFEGWYTTKTCTDKYDFSKPVYSNLVLYAKWDANKYTITFDHDSTTKEVTYDETYGTLPVPEKEGYDFDGWYIGDEEITADTIVKIEEDTTVVAKWTPKTYTLSFDEKGGNTVSDKTVTFNAEIGTLPVTAKTGYTFKGWTIDGAPISEGTIYNFADNKTAVADFVANKYKLTFEGLTDEIEVTYDDKYPTLPTPTVPHGQNFVGWFDGSTQIKEGNTVEITEDTELVPVFTNKPVYTVTFNANGGTPNSTQSVIEGDKASVPTQPTRTGHTFKGWFKDSAGTQTFDFNTEITGNIELYAGWSVDTYTVIFKDWNGTVLDTQTVNYGGNAVYGGVTPSRDADNTYTYTFDGWDKSLVNITEDTTITAKYIKTYIDYTVKFVADGTTVETFTGHFGDVISATDFPEVPAKIGHTGVWSVTTDITINGSIEVNAIYTPATYKLTFEGLTDEVYVTYGDVYPTLPTPNVPHGQNFAGWFDGTTEIKAGNVVEITKDTELVPVFTDKDVYTVTFNANGGTPNSTQSVIDGDKAIKPIDPTREGHTFKGWFKDVEGTQTFDFNTEITSDLELYAGWSLNSYEITFKNWDGTVLETKTLNYGETITYTGATPTRPAEAQYTYTFSGWSPALGTVTGEAEFEAQFETSVNQYTYTFYDEDGTTVLKEETADYGTVIVPPANPTKAATAQYTYTFKEWEGYTDGITLTGNVTYKAVYEETLNSYEITFKNWDGSVLETKTLNYGETISYTGATPTRPADVQYTYTFSGWSPALGTVSGTAEFEAQFETSVNQYTYTFYDEDGTTVLKEETADYGTVIVPPANPTKAADAQYTYTFKEWEGYTEGITLTGDVTYKAVYDKTVRTYTITFKNWNGEILEEKELPYDETATYTGATPTRPADAQYTYTFSGWSPALGTVTDEAEYVAQFESTVNQYTYTFYDEDGTTVLKEETVDYGTIIVAPTNPTKAADAQYTYTFKEWEGYTDGMTVAEDVTFKAVYDKTVNQYTYTFYDEDGTTVLKEATVDYGTVIVAPTNPTKAADAQYTYTFKEWEGYTDGMTVAEDVTFKAVYDKTVNQYKYTFYDEDGTTVLKEETVDYGTVIVAPANPTKAADAQYTYTFEEWEGYTDGMTVAEDVTFKALYEKTLNSYEITFKNYDGIVLETKTLNYGETITYTGATPEKPATAEFTYTFSGWSPALGTVSGTAEFEAQYTETLNSYTITFKNYDGTVLETKTLNYGETITYTGATPEKPATAQYTYTFSGWSPALGTVSGTAEFEAQYTETLNSYTITFKNYDGTVLETKAINYGEVITYTGTTPEKVGYTFDYWTIDSVAISATTTYTYDADKEVVATGWTANEYTVIYDGNGAEYGSTAESYHTYDDEENLTINGFIKVGNTFLGWSKDKNDTVATYEDEKLVKNLTAENNGVVVLYAIWEPNTYYVSYDANGGVGTMTDSEHKYGISSKLTKNVFEKTGYTFKGWAKSSTATAAEFADEGEVSTIAGPVDGAKVTLYAVWEENTYTVKFNGNGETSGLTDSLTVKYEETKKLTKNGFVKTGYNFSGWAETADGVVKYADEQQIQKLTATPNGTVDLYAVWEPITYKVKFVSDWSNTENPNIPYEQDFVYDVEEALKANQFERTGWVVTKWTGTDGTEYEPEALVKNLASTEGAVVELTANWMPIEYTVVYEGNGADTTSTPVADSYHKYDEPKNLNDNTYTREGYTFLGWRIRIIENPTTFSTRRLLMASAESGLFEDKEEVENLTDISGARVILEAIWEANKYTVEYNKNNDNATGSTVASEHYYDTASALTVNGFSLTGFSFGGWAETSDGDAKYTDGADALNLTSEPNGVVTLYATWNENSYTVKFNGNGATSGEMSDMTYTYTESKALNENKFERTGYTFGGWAESSSATTAKYADKEAVSMLTAENNGVVTLYAVWEPITYFVSYNGNGATEGTMSNSTHTYGKEEALTVNAYKKAGFAFKGWDTNSAGETVVYKDAALVKNLAENQDEIVTLYAVWGEEEYKVIYDGNGATEGEMEPSTHLTDTPKALTKNAFKKTGNNFLGWSEDKDAEVATYTDEQVVENLTTASEITLYAIWEEATYKVTFDVNGGNALELTDELKALGYYEDTETGKITVDVTYGGTYPQFPTATYPEGEMSFGGWAIDGNIIASGDLVEIEENTELVAVWTNKHIVVFHGYYNDGVDSLTTYVEDGETAVKPEDPTHSSFTFGGWYTDEECTDGNEYDFATIINKVNEQYQTIHLYPKWLVTVTFYYGPEAIESEKQAELLVAYNTVIEETDIPANRVVYGYWKDASVSDVYVGEEYEHNIEFMWHEAIGEDFELFDLTQPITKSLDLFNVAKVVDIDVSSSFDAINGANINATYTDNEPLYENILDVIFANGNLVNSVYEKIEQKEKVFDKLVSLGIIDENKNILNQAKFLKFALIGEERLETFVYENVENELTVDAKESISSYLNHLIAKNDGSAESFIRELIETLLKGDGKEAMTGVLKDMLTEMVDLEKDEFVKHINDYIDNSLAKGDTTSVETLIAPQIERLLTEAIAKDFVREMTKEQLTNFVNIYIGTLSEAELKAEVKAYIEALDETEIEAEVIEYVNSLSDTQITNEITSYINSLTDEQLKEEITLYVNGMEDNELSDAIVEYINKLSIDDLKTEIKIYIGSLSLTEQKEKVREYFDELETDEIKAEIKTYISDLGEDEIKAEIKTYINDLDELGKKKEIEKYIDGLTEAEKVQEVTSYVEDMSGDQFKAEIKGYILNLDEYEFKEELKKYLAENDKEYDNLIREYLGLADDVVITPQQKEENLDKVVDSVWEKPDKKDEVAEKAAEHIKTSNRAEYETKIINQVTSDFASYKADIVDKAMTGDLNSYIDRAVAKIIVGGSLDDYIDEVVNDIAADEATIATYINKTVEYIASDEVRLDTYIDKAINIIVSDETKKNNYISDTAYSIATGSNRGSYVEKAVNTIVNDASLKAEYTQKAIDKIVNGGDKAKYVEKAIKKILGGENRDKYINDTIDKIFADGKGQQYIDKAVAEIVDKTPADYSEIDKHITNMFATAEKKQKLVNYINDQFIESGEFREAILPDAIDMIFKDEDAKAEVVETIVDYVMNDEDAFEEVIGIAIEDLVEDAEFREHTIDKIAHYLEDHPEIMEKVVEYAKETELGVFVEKFIDELITKDQFEVSEDNLFVAEAIERAVSKYDYDSFMNEYIPDRFAGLIPDSILQPIYENALGGFKSQLDTAIEAAKNGQVAYVDSGVTVEFNPIADIIVPVFDKYLEFKEKAEDKLDGNNGTVGDIYDNAYGENKYVKELVELIAIESLLDGDKALATETLSGYSLKEFSDYYETIRNATVLLTDAGRWYVDNLPQDKAEAAQEKLAQKITEYFNSVLALVNTYAETEELPSYKDVLEIFEGDIPDRFFDKYESALSKVEAKVDVDDKLDTVYNKLAEKGIVSKFNTVLDKFIASKFNREITEEQIPLVYTFVRRALGYDDFYTVDTVFDVMNEHLTRFKVNEDKFEIGNNKLKITIERSYK